MHEVYVLTSGFRHKEIIDTYETLLWTERYSSAGEVVLTVSDTAWNRAELPEGAFLSIPESREIMIIETRSSEKGILTVTGPSLVSFLKNRILRDTWYNGDLYWPVFGVPGDICGELVRHMCINASGMFMTSDKVIIGGVAETIPNLKLGPMATGPLSEAVFIPVKYGDLYTGVKDICDSYELGLSLFPQNITETAHELIFTTYKGRDLTSKQAVNPVVQFNPALDSLTNTKELRSIAGYKNVAYAFAPKVTLPTYIVGVAYADSNAAATRGFDRRTLLVSADDMNTVDVSTPEAINKLKEELNYRAIDGLVNNNYVKMVDGELVPQSYFKYEIDYKLGDIIELGTSSGESTDARITEYIRSKDASGYTEYPTLSVIS